MTTRSKVLLIQDVQHLGRSGQIQEVARGYARNYLLPKKLAVMADRNTIRLKDKLEKERTAQALLDKSESEKLKAKIDTLILTETVKVDSEGHLYGSVSASDIVALLEKEGCSVLKSYIHLESSIKQLGVYDILLNLKEGVTSTFKLKVLSDAQEPELDTSSDK